MAQRPVFTLSSADSHGHPVSVAHFDFAWSPGLAPAQKRKNVAALHAVIHERVPGARPLEVSTKSAEPLGVALSAFRLQVTKGGRAFCVESLYQGSKVFQNGSGPFHALYSEPARRVRAAIQAHADTPLARFDWGGTVWPLEPKLAFYTWLYCMALHHEQNRALAGRLVRGRFTHFTDIEYNPRRTLNSQAFAVAYYLHLVSHGRAEEALSGRDAFLTAFPRALPRGFGTLPAKTSVRSARSARRVPRGNPVDMPLGRLL